MRIRWTVPAADDLENIKKYLDRHFPHFSQPTVRAIYHRARALKSAPEIGRPGHRSGTRELPLTPLPYVIVYAVKSEAIEIPHSSRRAGLDESRRKIMKSMPGAPGLASETWDSSFGKNLSPIKISIP